MGEPGAKAARQHNGFTVREHVGLHRGAQHVVGGQAQLLDAEDLVAGNTDADIRDAGELGLFRSGERDHEHALGAGDLHCLDDVGGVARRRDGRKRALEPRGGVGAIHHSIGIGEGPIDRALEAETLQRRDPKMSTELGMWGSASRNQTFRISVLTVASSRVT